MDDLIKDLLGHPKVLETRDHLHHSIPKYDHLLRVVKHARWAGKLLGADMSTLLRAAVVHDIDSRHGTLRNHGAIAARWAADVGETDAVCAAIVSHMYPLGGPRPTTREGWALALADKAATFGDLAQLISGLRGGISLAERRRLQGTDPFYKPRFVNARARMHKLRGVGHRIQHGAKQRITKHHTKATDESQS